MLNLKKTINKILAELRTHNVEYNITKTAGNSTIDTSQTTFTKCGNVITARIRLLRTGDVASGANVFEGKINTTELLPKESIIGVGFYSVMPFGLVINNLGTVQVRNLSPSAWSSGAAVIVTATYLGGVARRLKALKQLAFTSERGWAAC